MYNLRNRKPATNEANESEMQMDADGKQLQATLPTTSTNIDTNTTTQNKDSEHLFWLNEEDIPEKHRFLGFDISADNSTDSGEDNNKSAMMDPQCNGAEQIGEEARHVTTTNQSGTSIQDGNLTTAGELPINKPSDEIVVPVESIHNTDELDSDIASERPATSAHANTTAPPDLLSQIAILMKSNLDALKSDTNARLNKLESSIKSETNARLSELKSDIKSEIKSENNTRFHRLETNIKSENETRFKLLSEEIKIQTKQTNDNLSQLSQHIELKLNEVQNKYEKVNLELNEIKTIQTKQSDKIDQIETKVYKDISKQVEYIREDLSKDLEKQHATIKETLHINNDAIIDIVDSKLTNQSITCQTNLLQQSTELATKIDEARHEILNQTKNENEIQTGKINTLQHVVNKQETRLTQVEEKLNQQPQTNIPNIYVTCTGNTNQHLDNNPPKFYGRASNPKEFLTKLKRYYERSITNKDTYENVEHLHDIIEQCFDHHSAKWFELCKTNINTWTQFENSFLNKYWSRDIQRGIKHRIETERYRPGGKLSRAEYFIERVLTLRSITPPLTDEEIVTVLAEHFSELIQDARRVQNVHDVTEFELLLQREDLKDAQQRTRRSNHPRNEQQQQQRPAQNHSNPHQSYNNNTQRTSYPPRNNNYQNRPQYQNYHNRRDNQQQRPGYNNYSPQNGNNYHQNGNFKKEERSYPTREQHQVCSAIVERSGTPPNNPASTSSSPALNC